MVSFLIIPMENRHFAVKTEMSLEYVNFSEVKCFLSSLSSSLEMQSLFKALEIYIYHFIVKTKRIYCSCMIGLIIKSDKNELFKINLKKNCENVFH